MSSVRILENKIEQVRKLVKNIDVKMIEQVIGALSLFMTGNNDDYHYNSTYLEDYKEEFVEFLRHLKIKDKVIEEIATKVTSKYMVTSSKDMQVRLVVDDLWLVAPKIIIENNQPHINREWFGILKDGNVERVVDKFLCCKYILAREEHVQVYYYRCDFDIENPKGSEIGVIDKLEYFIKIFNATLERRIEKNEEIEAI